MVVLFILILPSFSQKKKKILLSWILEELQHIQRLLILSDKLFDPQLFLLLGVEFVW